MTNPIEAEFGFHYISESCLYVIYGFVEVGYLDVRKRICHYLCQAYFREICVSCIAFKNRFITSSLGSIWEQRSFDIPIREATYSCINPLFGRQTFHCTLKESFVRGHQMKFL